MAAARLEMPIGGKRAKMGTGRARGKPLGVWLDTERHARLAQVAAAEGITRTALIERWIDEHYAQIQSADHQVPGEG
jgi:hypothetical protein